MTKKQVDGKWKKLEHSLIPYTDSPKEMIECIKELYGIYDSSLLVWLGGLFDRDIGGFYYSNSARDGEDFFPDIESTGQAVAILEATGLISSYNDIPEWMRLRIAGFICSCEDPESGYFYNPQWSKELTDSKLPRRARDTRWAIELAEMCNFDITYPTAFTQIKSGNMSNMDFLKSDAALIDHLDSLDWEHRFYRNMDYITNIADAIVAAGHGETLIKYIEAKRDADGGVWGADRLNRFDQLKTIGAVLWIYFAASKPVPDAMKIFDFAIKSFDEDELDGISYTCARLSTIKLLLRVLTEFGGKEEVRLVRDMVSIVVAELHRIIPITVEALKKFKKPDGSFSWMPEGSSPTSHSMPVAKENSYEGDVNATLLAISVAKKITEILTLSDEIIPIFSSENMISFEESIRD